RRERRSRADLRVSVAILAGAGGPPHRPALRSGGPDPQESGFAAVDRLGLERRRHSADEATALPRLLSVLRGRWPARLPALPAQRRHLPRRAIQHRLLCFAHASRRAAVRSRRRRFRLGWRRLPSLPEPPRAGCDAACARPLSAAAAQYQAPAGVAIRVP